MQIKESKQLTPAQQLARKEYTQRLEVNRLRRMVFQEADPSTSKLMSSLADAEVQLREVERQRAAAWDPSTGLIMDTKAVATHRGADTTGLEAKVFLTLAQVPTSIYHLLDPSAVPLMACTVKAARPAENGTAKRRVRVSSFVEGYSATAVTTLEIPVGQTSVVTHLPPFFPARAREVTELTQAMLNVTIEDLDGNVELQQTEAIKLLPRTCAPLAIQNPQNGQWVDTKPYLGAFVTPNAPQLMTFLREAARQHPAGLLAGYQGSPAEVEPQVKAIYDALKKAEITYVNSVIDFAPQLGFATQRVRLPRESLSDKSANCIDGTVLCASLLEGISMSPAIVLVPGHAFLAWETWDNSNEWRFLETTMIGSATFEQACASATRTAQVYAAKNELTVMPLRMLRADGGILPME